MQNFPEIMPTNVELQILDGITTQSASSGQTYSYDSWAGRTKCRWHCTWNKLSPEEEFQIRNFYQNNRGEVFIFYDFSLEYYEITLEILDDSITDERIETLPGKATSEVKIDDEGLKIIPHWRLSESTGTFGEDQIIFKTIGGFPSASIKIGITGRKKYKAQIIGNYSKRGQSCSLTMVEVW